MRMLVFPDRAVGTLHAFYEESSPGSQLAEARGTVILEAPEVFLKVPAAVAADLGFLEALAPRAIDGLMCVRCEDASQLRHAAHLDLRAIVLGYALLGGAALEHVAAHPHLRTLDICAAWGIDDHVAFLERLPKLRRLGVYETSFGDAHVGHLAPMGELEALDAGYTQITDAGVARLPPLPRLRELDVAETEVGDDACAALASRPTLRALRLGRTRVTSRGVAALGSLPLEELRLSSTAVDDAAIAPLATMGTLRQLDLSHARVSTDGGARLRAALPACRVSI